jgi:hypothetical protein
LFDDEDVIYKRVNYLKDRHWIDKQTKDITFSLILFNGQDEPLACEALLKFEFSRGLIPFLYCAVFIAQLTFHICSLLISLAGSVKPTMQVETVTLSPYFSQREFKLVLEILFIGLLVFLFSTELHEIRARLGLENAFAMGAGGSEKVAIMTLGQAIVEHFWSGHEPIGNVVDMVTIGLGVSICGTWLQVVFAMATAEAALVNLHRPTGDVAYDDTDHDVWSEYHHNVAHAEHLIAAVINRMVI